LIEDAIKHGATILNERGGRFYKTLATPTVVGPLNASMRLWTEEQFGPVQGIATFGKIEEALEYITESEYGLQSCIFTENVDILQQYIDTMVFQVGRVNIGTQDQRGPDQFPFTGRKHSALGVLNAAEGIRAFSIPSLVACKVKDVGLMNKVAKNCRFLE